MGLAGESGGVAGRAELPGARRPDHPAVCCAVPRRKVRGRGAGLGRAVWPEGRELELNTASERIVLFLCSFPFPLPPPSLNPPGLSTSREEWARGEGRESLLRGSGSPGRGGKGRRVQGVSRGHARPRTFSNPQCPHLDPRRAHRTAPPLLCSLCSVVFFFVPQDTWSFPKLWDAPRARSRVCERGLGPVGCPGQRVVRALER